jgi:hypothetical protein
MNEHEAQDKRLDEMLDAALAEYGAVEPLRGLEERVLGRLRGAEARRPWWIWGAVATAVVAVAIAALLLERPAQRSAPPVVEKQPAVTAPQAAQPTAPVAPQPTVARAPVRHAAGDAQLARAPQLGISIPALPKRDVFPTPGPPTSEELLLARYLRVTPREEVLAQINRSPLEFHEDPQAAPSTSTSPQKSEGTK